MQRLSTSWNGFRIRTAGWKLTSSLVLSALGCASTITPCAPVYFGMGEYDKAIDCAQSVLKKDPMSAANHFILGKAYFGKERSLDRSNPDYVINAEMCLEKAFLHFRIAALLDPDAWAARASEELSLMVQYHTQRSTEAAANGDSAKAALEHHLSRIANPEK